MKRIVWDWNGTLMDDVSVCNGVLNRMLARRGVAPVEREKYREIFTFPVADYYREAGFDFEKEPFPVLAEEYMADYGAHVDGCPLIDGGKEGLHRLACAGFRQDILSATRQAELTGQVYDRGIGGLFDEICGTDTILAHGKRETALAWRERHREELARAFFVGDSPHDAEVAELMGIRPLLVSWGHVSRRRLLETGYPVFDGLSPLLDYLEER